MKRRTATSKSPAPKAAKAAAKPKVAKAAAKPKAAAGKKKNSSTDVCQLVPYLTIGGNKGAEALDFYAKAFGAVEKKRHVVDGKLLHAETVIGGNSVFISDEFAPSGPPHKVGLHVHVEKADDWWERAVAAGCKVEMPLADAFWGDRYGKVVDPYGYAWSIASTNEQLSDDTMAERAKKWLASEAAQGEDEKKSSAASPKKKKAAAASPKSPHKK